ncbi:capsule polysaccharide biosynthesis protein [Leptodontidium sp. 2 PMI_412]|nr:capsule polysaccharide biosynthesis protein [Leptodontidium sp. 2 PMI_412]
MESPPTPYPIPLGMHVIPTEQLDLRPDSEIDHDILHPKPISSSKNIFFFWHTGYLTMHPYTQRTVRAWHRRFSKAGWTIYVIDKQPGSPRNIEKFLDVNDQTLFPEAFAKGTLTGTYSIQHTSDLVRLPLLLKYGGVYTDVGCMQIGDLDALWNKTVGDSSSGYEVLSYHAGNADEYSLTNYFLCCDRGNALFDRAHRLLLKLWEGKTSTEGMHASPLLKGVPLMGGSFSIDDEQGRHDAVEASRMLTDYIIQGQVLSMVMGLVDEEGGWNGPEYIKDRVYAVEFMVGAQLINDLTAWDGQKAFDLMSLEMPKEGETESDEQATARDIVVQCLTKSYGFKLAHGMILRVYPHTLGSLWRKFPGSDVVVGTYAHWLRYAMVYWSPDKLPEREQFTVSKPIKVGPLLREI